QFVDVEFAGWILPGPGPLVAAAQIPGRSRGEGHADAIAADADAEDLGNPRNRTVRRHRTLPLACHRPVPDRAPRPPRGEPSARPRTGVRHRGVSVAGMPVS